VEDREERVVTMPETPSLDTLTDQRVQFAELEARLVDEYGSDRRALVHRTVEEERDRFTDARVHTFVPILVERSVRSRLGAHPSP
jgi:hypothetical protein